MATTTVQKIEREVVATTMQELSKATFNGWSLNFTINKDGDTVKNANVSGHKDGNNVSGSISENGYVNIGFNVGGRDKELAQALIDELIAIKDARVAQEA